MSHSAEKCKRGDPLGFINIYSVAKYQKTRKGDSFETLKNFRKKIAQCRKKSNLLVSSGFVGYVKIVKNESGDPFALISADRTWPYASSFSFDCKKSDPIRVRLKSEGKKRKKLATVRVGHFSLEKRRLKT